jgi:hypothetical protein
VHVSLTRAEVKEMNRTWTVAVAMVVAMAAHAESPKTHADALVTVFAYDGAGVPWIVMERAKRVASAAFVPVGIEIRWVKGRRLGEPREVAIGEVLTVVFDGPAPPEASPQALASAHLGSKFDADVYVFYHRVAACECHVGLPELLGNVLAHELTHVFEGVVRHSSEGLMKAVWSARDYPGMAGGPLPLAAEDLNLLRAHFKKEMRQAPTFVAAR